MVSPSNLATPRASGCNPAMGAKESVLVAAVGADQPEQVAAAEGEGDIIDRGACRTDAEVIDGKQGRHSAMPIKHESRRTAKGNVRRSGSCQRCSRCYVAR
jgi:hypothetical protein